MVWTPLGLGYGTLRLHAHVELVLWWGDGRSRAALRWVVSGGIVWIDVASA
jgi:hypothetical protein